jgi:hypothetical protein
MQYTVCNIKIRLYTFPDEHDQVNQKPEISLRFKEFPYALYKIPAKKQSSNSRNQDPCHNVFQVYPGSEQKPDDQHG